MPTRLNDPLYANLVRRLRGGGFEDSQIEAQLQKMPAIRAPGPGARQRTPSPLRSPARMPMPMLDEAGAAVPPPDAPTSSGFDPREIIDQLLGRMGSGGGAQPPPMLPTQAGRQPQMNLGGPSPRQPRSNDPYGAAATAPELMDPMGPDLGSYMASAFGREAMPGPYGEPNQLSPPPNLPGTPPTSPAPPVGPVQTAALGGPSAPGAPGAAPGAPGSAAGAAPETPWYDNPDLWQTLMEFGFGMMRAGERPGSSFLGALGEGGAGAMRARGGRAAAKAKGEVEKAKLDIEKAKLEQDSVSDVYDKGNKVYAITKKGKEIDLGEKGIPLEDALDLARKAATVHVTDPATFQTYETFDESLYNRMVETMGYSGYRLGDQGGPGQPGQPQYTEGDQAINRATGQKVVFQGGRWVPLQ